MHFPSEWKLFLPSGPREMEFECNWSGLHSKFSLKSLERMNGRIAAEKALARGAFRQSFLHRFTVHIELYSCWISLSRRNEICFANTNCRWIIEPSLLLKVSSLCVLIVIILPRRFADSTRSRPLHSPHRCDFQTEWIIHGPQLSF